MSWARAAHDNTQAAVQGKRTRKWRQGQPSPPLPDIPGRSHTIHYHANKNTINTHAQPGRRTLATAVDKTEYNVDTQNARHHAPNHDSEETHEQTHSSRTEHTTARHGTVVGPLACAMPKLSRRWTPICEGVRPFLDRRHTCSSTSVAVTFSHDGAVRLYGRAESEIPLLQRTHRQQPRGERHRSITSNTSDCEGESTQRNRVTPPVEQRNGASRTRQHQMCTNTDSVSMGDGRQH